MLTKQPAVYIMANKPNGTIYIGVTSNLIRRVYEHKAGTTPGFTSTYGCKTLVYYELHADMTTAITREKHLKDGPRRRKIALVETQNPTWADLYPDIVA